MTHADLIATVGRTPLVELRRLAKDLPGRVLAKLEMRNPCGNVKDRVAVAHRMRESQFSSCNISLTYRGYGRAPPLRVGSRYLIPDSD